MGLQRMKVVALLGNAPRSSGYRPGALLLSYRAFSKSDSKKVVAARELHPALKLFRLVLSCVSYAAIVQNPLFEGDAFSHRLKSAKA